MIGARADASIRTLLVMTTTRARTIHAIRPADAYLRIQEAVVTGMKIVMTAIPARMMIAEQTASVRIRTLQVAVRVTETVRMMGTCAQTNIAEETTVATPPLSQIAAITTRNALIRSLARKMFA